MKQSILLILLMMMQVSAFVNYSMHDYNGTLVNVTGEYEEYRQGNWLWGSWLFWTNLLPGILQYLPIAIVVIMLGFVGWVKSGTIVVPAIWFMFFATVMGLTLWVGLAPYLGYIVLGVLLSAIIIAFLKTFYG